MFRRISFIIIVAIIASLMCTPVFAAPADDKSDKKPAVEKAVDTKDEGSTSPSPSPTPKGEGKEELNLTITTPNDEKTTNRDYTIVGRVNLNNVKIKLYKRISDKVLELITNPNGEIFWEVGSNKYFKLDVTLAMKSINQLSNVNRFRIEAISMDDWELKDVANFSVTLLNPGKIKTDVFDLTIEKVLTPAAK